jgi:hypothetical protein
MPSFEKFNYALRTAKNIERKMLCETFARLPEPTAFGLAVVPFALYLRRPARREMVSKLFSA